MVLPALALGLAKKVGGSLMKGGLGKTLGFKGKRKRSSTSINKQVKRLIKAKIEGKILGQKLKAVNMLK